LTAVEMTITKLLKTQSAAKAPKPSKKNQEEER
jgi:hypothetical protein